MSTGTIQYIKVGNDSHSLDATKLNGAAASDYQITDNLVTTLSILNNRKSYKYPSAKCIYTMVGDLSILESSVASETYTLNLSVSPGGYGTIIVDGGLQDSYTAGTTVTMSASPISGCTFLSWLQDGSTDLSKTVYMDSDKTFTATFALVNTSDESTDLEYNEFEELL